MNDILSQIPTLGENWMENGRGDELFSSVIHGLSIVQATVKRLMVSYQYHQHKDQLVTFVAAIREVLASYKEPISSQQQAATYLYQFKVHFDS